MFSTTIRATIKTDVDATIERLRADCEQSELPSPTIELIVTQARLTLSDLIAHGREVAALGSRMSVSRDIAGDGYHVTIGLNTKQSLLGRLTDAIRGR